MTEYKPRFNRVDRDGLARQLLNTPQSNSEEMDYKSEYERMVKENKELRLIIGKLILKTSKQIKTCK